MFLQHCIGFGLLHHSFFFQSLGPELSYSRMFVDLAIHGRLGKARLITFVMTIAPITDQVDHEIFVELVTVGESSSRSLDASDGIIRIDVDARDFKSLCHVTGM